jgi:hypothetical protein
MESIKEKLLDFCAECVVGLMCVFMLRKISKRDLEVAQKQNAIKDEWIFDFGPYELHGSWFMHRFFDKEQYHQLLPWWDKRKIKRTKVDRLFY